MECFKKPGHCLCLAIERGGGSLDNRQKWVSIKDIHTHLSGLSWCYSVSPLENYVSLCLFAQKILISIHGYIQNSWQIKPNSGKIFEGLLPQEPPGFSSSGTKFQIRVILVNTVPEETLVAFKICQRLSVTGMHWLWQWLLGPNGAGDSAVDQVTIGYIW